jgi:hypothetical protein
LAADCTGETMLFPFQESHVFVNDDVSSKDLEHHHWTLLWQVWQVWLARNDNLHGGNEDEK